MKKNILFAMIVGLSFLTAHADQIKDKVSYVNPMIGTEGIRSLVPVPLLALCNLVLTLIPSPTISMGYIKARSMSIVLAISILTILSWASVIRI